MENISGSRSMITHSPIILDDLRPAPSKARARRTDPSVSHDAAKRVELGKAERQRQAIYTCLLNRGPMTVPEIADNFFWSAHELGKRMTEISEIACTGESRNGSRVWAVL